jgi:hypothetical protein
VTTTLATVAEGVGLRKTKQTSQTKVTDNDASDNDAMETDVLETDAGGSADPSTEKVSK